MHTHTHTGTRYRVVQDASTGGYVALLDNDDSNEGYCSREQEGLLCSLCTQSREEQQTVLNGHVTEVVVENEQKQLQCQVDEGVCVCVFVERKF